MKINKYKLEIVAPDSNRITNNRRRDKDSKENAHTNGSDLRDKKKEKKTIKDRNKPNMQKR